jgi:hypothetical protein
MNNWKASPLSIGKNLGLQAQIIFMAAGASICSQD